MKQTLIWVPEDFIFLKISNTFKNNELDDLIFQFAANKGSDFGELKKVASGGELSRIMLAIKAILATYEKLPTLIFDEIDTGVSGEISNKMGGIMKEMGKNMQLFSITHLPQVASKGTHQYKVYKEENMNNTSTKMKRLTKEDRVKELAEMLGGKTFSDSAVSHAKQLLMQSWLNQIGPFSGILTTIEMHIFVPIKTINNEL